MAVGIALQAIKSKLCPTSWSLKSDVKELKRLTAQQVAKSDFEGLEGLVDLNDEQEEDSETLQLNLLKKVREANRKTRMPDLKSELAKLEPIWAKSHGRPR